MIDSQMKVEVNKEATVVSRDNNLHNSRGHLREVNNPHNKGPHKEINNNLHNSKVVNPLSNKDHARVNTLDSRPEDRSRFYKKPLFLGLVIAVVVAIVLASVFFAFMGDEDDTSSDNGDDATNQKVKFLYTWDDPNTGQYIDNKTYTFYDNSSVKIERSLILSSTTYIEWDSWNLNADNKTIIIDGYLYNYSFLNDGDTLELSGNNATRALQKL